MHPLMPRILVFQHVAAEPLGTLDPLIRRRGHRIRFVNFERHPDAEPTIDRYRGLVVLGGPMNVEDQAQRPHLRTELRVIEQALKQNKPVLGICLGAQLLAHALGAPVRKHDRAEIGWYALELTAAGLTDKVISPLGATTTVFQWHARSYALPDGAVQLARTRTCEQQAFRYGETAYGIQFHPEVDQGLIERWLGNPDYGRELAAAGLPQNDASIRALSPSLALPMQTQAEPMFENFLDLIGRPQRRIVFPSREWTSPARKSRTGAWPSGECRRSRREQGGRPHPDPRQAMCVKRLPSPCMLRA
jgi:GMP synthase (glutamine-hydrolysing)